MRRIRRRHHPEWIARQAGRQTRRRGPPRTRLADPGHVLALSGIPRRADPRSASRLQTRRWHLLRHVLGPDPRSTARRRCHEPRRLNPGDPNKIAPTRASVVWPLHEDASTNMVKGRQPRRHGLFQRPSLSPTRQGSTITRKSKSKRSRQAAGATGTSPKTSASPAPSRPYLGMTRASTKAGPISAASNPTRPRIRNRPDARPRHSCSIGDQLHPRGTLDPAAYELIGKVYAKVAIHRLLVKDANPIAQIGFFQTPATGTPRQPSLRHRRRRTRMLTQLKHQFDVVGPASDFPNTNCSSSPTPSTSTTHCKRLNVVPKSRRQNSRHRNQRPRPRFPPPNSPARDQTARHVAFKRQYLPSEKISLRMSPPPITSCTNPASASPPPASQVLAKVVEPYYDRSWRNFVPI